MRPLRCSIVIRLHGRSKWIRWWHCRCRFTPSEAMAPVSSSRTSLSASANSSTTSCCSRSGRPPWRTRTARRPSPSLARSVSASHCSVACRSEKTTARNGEPAPTPIARSVSTSAASLALRPSSTRATSAARRSSAAISLSASRPGAVILRSLPSRLSTVSASARWEERNALSSVYGNSWRPLPPLTGARPDAGYNHTSASSSKTASSAGVAATGTPTGGRRSAQAAPTSAVVRRRAGQDQRVRARGEHARELVVECPPVDQVAGGGDLLADPLDALGVEPDQGNREARPQLVLELLEDVPGSDHQDAVAAPAPHQLGEHHADLERLAQADRVGDEQPWPQRLERGLDRVALVLELVEKLPVAHGQAGLGCRQRRLADQRLEVQPAAPEPWGRVEDEGGVLRAQRLHVVQLGEEGRLLLAHQLGGADHPHELAVGRGLLHRADQPLLVAHHDLRSRGDQRQRRRRCWHPSSLRTCGARGAK